MDDDHPHITRPFTHRDPPDNVALFASVAGFHRNIQEEEYLVTLGRIASSPHMIWKANSVGWTAIHFCCIHWNYDKYDDWRELQMQICEEGHPEKLWSLRTNLGVSSIDLWMRHFLDPLPWQKRPVHERASARKEAMENVMDDPELLEHVRERIAVLRSMRPSSVAPLQARSSVEIVSEFWNAMEQLLVVATLGTADMHRVDFVDERSSRRGPPGKLIFSTLHALAQTDCPRIIAQLAVLLYPNQLYHREEKLGHLPLHIIAFAASSMTVYDNDATDEDSNECPEMIQVLLESNPEAAKSRTKNGRFPLHLALAHSNYADVQHTLWKAYPWVVSICDPVTGLPSFALAAAETDETKASSLDIMTRAEHRAAGVTRGLWRFQPARKQKEALDKALEQEEILQLGCVYDLLRSMPTAIQLGGTKVDLES